MKYFSVGTIIATYFLAVALVHFLYQNRAYFAGRFLYTVKKIRTQLYYKSHGFNKEGVKKRDDGYYEVDPCARLLDLAGGLSNMISLKARFKFWLNRYGYHIGIIGGLIYNVSGMIESNFIRPYWY